MYTNGLTTPQLKKSYSQAPSSYPSRELKRALGIRGNHLEFLKELRDRGIVLRQGDDVFLDYSDDSSWSTQEWIKNASELNLRCQCNCGQPIKILGWQRKKGISKYLRNHRPFSSQRKRNISKSLTGKKRSESFKRKRKEYMTKKWKDPKYVSEQKARMSEINARPEKRKKHREARLRWQKNNPDWIVKLKKINKEWARKNPQKKIEAAKKGHKALAAKGKKSSIEIILEKALKKINIDFVPEWEYELGIADFKIGHVIVFADGDYWHGPDFPEQRKKDKRQKIFLEQKGFTVLRFTGTQIRTNIEECVNAIQHTFNVAPPNKPLNQNDAATHYP